MIASNNIEVRRREILDLIACANVDQAIKRLIDFYKDYCYNKEELPILISREWSELRMKKSKNIISHVEAEISTNKIVNSIIEI